LKLTYNLSPSKGFACSIALGVDPLRRPLLTLPPVRNGSEVVPGVGGAKTSELIGKIRSVRLEGVDGENGSGGSDVGEVSRVRE